MHASFLDFSDWDYDVDTAYTRPLGGSQSALCYLAEQLAVRGVETTLATGLPEARDVRGVHCVPLRKITAEQMQAFDAVVLNNLPSKGPAVRAAMATAAPLILWIGHASDQPAARTLADPKVRDAFDAFVFVSDWQRNSFIEEFSLAADRCHVLRNAFSPAFENLVEGDASLQTTKSTHPTLAYTSTPFRGLDLLVAAFPRIRQQHPTAELAVYSSMSVYQVGADADREKYGDLYQACQETEGIHYIGAVPQPQLAQAMRATWLLAYPNHFAETSCIAVMEALAAGCHVVTSELGALPETTGGYASLIPTSADTETYLQQFTAAVCQAIEAPNYQQRGEQVAWMHREHTWTVRSRQWLALLEKQIAKE